MQPQASRISVLSQFALLSQDNSFSRKAEAIAAALTLVGLTVQWDIDDTNTDAPPSAFVSVYRHPQEGQPALTIIFNQDGTVEMLSFGIPMEASS